MKVLFAGATLIAISLLIQAAAGQKNSITLATLHAQPGSPLQVAGGVFNDTELRVLLVNVSEREVTQTVLGLVLEDGASTVPPTTRSGRVCEARIPPGGFLAVTETDNGFDGAESYFRDKGITRKRVTVGVIEARFAGGGAWTYPLESKGRFEQQEDGKLEQKINVLVRNQFGERSPSAALFGSAPLLEGKISTCR